MSLRCIQGRESPILVTHNRKEIIVKADHYHPNNLNGEMPSGNYQNGCAVFIRNVCKRYEDGPPILQNFCMNVRKGTIYGLLGSSGCGKTTILSCIVGLQECDSGELLVFGKKPGTKGSGIPGRRLGYMPQELALYNHLSIREIIQFYGRVYRMTSREVTEQWDFLNDLLKLPSKFKLIADLSGGQQRRTSLALALIHSPELLILDEPTVGLDPLLRRNIWDYLYKIVQKLKTTIIITTHYIEEARLSNTIGVMRNGRLLVEDTPSNLLKTYNSDLLESVVLQLCRKDNNNVKNLAVTNTNSVPENNVSFKSTWNGNENHSVSNPQCELVNGIFRHEFDCDISEQLSQKQRPKGRTLKIFTKIMSFGFLHTFQRIYGFTTVILLAFLRNPVFLISLLFMPSIQGSLTLLTLGSPLRGLPLGIVNLELANWTQECALPKHSGNYCDLSALSCKYLNRLKGNNVFVLNSYASEADALSQTQLGNILGYLAFPANYSHHSLDFAEAGRFALNESIEGSRIHAHLDHSQYLQVFLMVKHLYRNYLDYVKHLSVSCQIGGEQATLPIHFRKPIYGTYEDDYTSFIIPGLILVSLGGVGYGPTGVILVADRKQGTLSRAHVAGLATGDVLIGHLITQAIIAISQIIIWSGILHYVFDFVSLGSPWLLITFYMLTQMCGTGIGLVAGQVCKNEQQVLLIAVFFFTVFLFSGCVLFPIQLMSSGWQYASYIIPTAVPTLSLRSVTVRGMELANPFVWSGLVILLGWIFALLLCAVLLYKKNK